MKARPRDRARFADCFHDVRSLAVSVPGRTVIGNRTCGVAIQGGDGGPCLLDCRAEAGSQ